MKKLIVLFLILNFVPSLSFAQVLRTHFTMGLNLNINDEFEYKVSNHSNETSINNLNQSDISEAYAIHSYKFKVVTINEDSYKLECNYSLEDDYRRKKLHDQQWLTVNNNHRELHNDKTTDIYRQNAKLELIVAKDGYLRRIKILDYEKNKNQPSKKSNLLSTHSKNLNKYFFKLPNQLSADQHFIVNKTAFKANETSFTVDSINQNTTYLSFTRSTRQTNKMVSYKGGEKKTVSSKGMIKESGQLTIDNKKGYIVESLSKIRVELASDDAQNTKSKTDISVRCVTISNNTSPFTCTYVDDGNKGKATLYKTNVTIRGKIKNPDAHREVVLKWSEREPSAYKQMGMIVPLEEDNTFEFRLYIDELKSITIAHKEKAKFHILPGDNLFISIDTNSFEDSIRATGVGASHVNLCLDKQLFEKKNKCSNSTVGRKLYKMRKTASPEEFNSYALSMLKLKQDYLLSIQHAYSPEVFLALYWTNQCKIVGSIREYIDKVNYNREKEGLKPYNIEKYNYPPLDTLIHADNDLMSFANNYDHFIRHYALFYLKTQIERIPGKGRRIQVKEYFDELYTNNYNYAHIFFTGKTQESLKYSIVNDAMERASWEVYEELLLKYKSDYPQSSRLAILESSYKKSKKASILSPAYNFELKDLNGKTHHLSDYKGKAVYVHFRSTVNDTDGSYEKLQKELQEAYQDSNIVFIHILFGRDKEKARSYIEKHQQKGIFLLASGQTETLIRREYFFSSVPHYTLIDTNGNCVSAKEVDPYFLINYKEIINEALHPPTTSINFKERSELMTYISLGLLSLLLIAFLVIYLIKKRNSRQLKLAKLNEQLRESELKAIRAQMNPHFMHNCLNAIQNLVQKKELDKAHQYISKFATLIRDTLTLSDKEEISLSQEIEMVNNYVALEQLRFPLDFEIEIAPEIDIYSIFIPPMLLQPTVENAIIHGLSKKVGNKSLKLSVFLKGELININIVDNGIGRVASLAQTSNGTGKGASFTQERLELLKKKYGRVCDMKINDQYDDLNNAIGTTVKITIEDEV